MEEKFVSANDLCIALETLYEDVDKRIELGNAAYANATKSEYSWVNVAKQWRKLFNTILWIFNAHGIKQDTHPKFYEINPKSAKKIIVKCDMNTFGLSFAKDDNLGHP